MIRMPRMTKMLRLPVVSRMSVASMWQFARRLTTIVVVMGFALISSTVTLAAKNGSRSRGSGNVQTVEEGSKATASKKNRKAKSKKIKRKRRNNSGRTKRSLSPRSRGRVNIPTVERIDPQMRISTIPARPQAGDKVTVSVRLLAGSATGTGRHAAFHLKYDSELLDYAGYKPTGRGALLVQEARRESGSLVVYRSSLHQGFAASELLVEFEFVAIAPGNSPVTMRDVRLMGGRARNFTVMPYFAEVEIE
jgi:hypothetical protein